MAPNNRKLWNFISDFCQEILQKSYYKFGITVYEYPIRYFTVGMILTALCALGLLNFSYDTNPTDLYVPNTAEIYKHKQTFEKYFGEGGDDMNLMLHSKNNENLLTPENMNITYSIFLKSISITSSYNGDIYTFSNLCSRPYPSYSNCSSLESGFLGLFDFDPSTWQTQSAIQSRLDAYSSVLFVKFVYLFFKRFFLFFA